MSIYYFFYKIYQKNLINISHETKPTVASKKSVENRSLRGVFQSYADPQKQLLESDAWKNHVLEKYKRGMND
jgi:hypothetical protein